MLFIGCVEALNYAAVICERNSVESDDDSRRKLSHRISNVWKRISLSNGSGKITGAQPAIGNIEQAKISFKEDVDSPAVENLVDGLSSRAKDALNTVVSRL